MFVTGTLLQYKRMFMQGEHEVLLDLEGELNSKWFLVTAGAATITRLRGLLGKRVNVRLTGDMVVHLEPS
jgi:hypothetical protein